MNLSLAEIPLPLLIRPASPMSDDELLRFCTANDPLRVERTAHGDLLIMTPTGGVGSHINFRVARLLDEWAERDGRGLGFDSNGGFSLPDGSMRAPDAAWISLDRWQTLTPQKQRSFPPLCPDFIIELRSESDNLKELREKMEQWLANGVQLAWLIDPMEKVVTIYRPGEAPETLHDPTSIQGTGPMCGFELVLQRIWPTL